MFPFAMFPFDFAADRRRPEPPAFADTAPAWFRSEAFVEDLPPVPPLEALPRRLWADEPTPARSPQPA